MNYIWISSFIFDVAFSWYCFLHSDFTLGKRRNWVKVLCALALVWLYLPEMFPVNTALLRVVYRLLIYFVWIWLGEDIPRKGSLYTALFWVAAYTAFSNIFFGPFTSEFVSGRADLVASRFWSQVFISAINIIIRFLYFGSISKLLPLSGMIGANFSGIAFVVLLNIILTYSKIAIMPSSRNFDATQTRMNTYYILLQAALFMALIAFEYSRRRTVQAATLEIQNVAGQALLESIKDKQQSEDAIKSLRHDLKNHALSMKLLLDKGDDQGVRDYLDSIVDAAKNPVQGYNTGSDLLDGLLKQKLSPAKDAGVDVTCTLDFSDANDMMDNFDLCVLMGNILDNATEACEAMPEASEKYIRISGGMSANCQIIQVENSCVSRDAARRSPSAGAGQDPAQIQQLPPTTKANKAIHGFGLRNIKAVLIRYGGTMDIEQSPGNYSITLLIPADI